MKRLIEIYDTLTDAMWVLAIPLGLTLLLLLACPSPEPPDVPTPPDEPEFASAVLSWSPNAPRDSVIAYRVFHGLSPRIYSDSSGVGLDTSKVFAFLKVGVWHYFAVKAQNKWGLSKFSEEAAYFTDDKEPEPSPTDSLVMIPGSDVVLVADMAIEEGDRSWIILKDLIGGLTFNVPEIYQTICFETDDRIGVNEPWDVISNNSEPDTTFVLSQNDDRTRRLCYFYPIQRDRIITLWMGMPSIQKKRIWKISLIK